MFGAIYKEEPSTAYYISSQGFAGGLNIKYLDSEDFDFNPEKELDLSKMLWLVRRAGQLINEAGTPLQYGTCYRPMLGVIRRMEALSNMVEVLTAPLLRKYIEEVVTQLPDVLWGGIFANYNKQEFVERYAELRKGMLPEFRRVLKEMRQDAKDDPSVTRLPCCIYIYDRTPRSERRKTGPAVRSTETHERFHAFIGNVLGNVDWADARVRNAVEESFARGLDEFEGEKETPLYISETFRVIAQVNKIALNQSYLEEILARLAQLESVYKIDVFWGMKFEARLEQHVIRYNKFITQGESDPQVAAAMTAPITAYKMILRRIRAKYGTVKEFTKAALTKYYKKPKPRRKKEPYVAMPL